MYKIIIPVIEEKIKNGTKYPYSHYIPFYNGFKGKITYNKENNYGSC